MSNQMAKWNMASDKHHIQRPKSLVSPIHLTPDHSSRIGLSPSKMPSFRTPFSGRLTMYEGASTLLVKTLFLDHFSFLGEFLCDNGRVGQAGQQAGVA